MQSRSSAYLFQNGKLVDEKGPLVYDSALGSEMKHGHRAQSTAAKSKKKASVAKSIQAGRKAGKGNGKVAKAKAKAKTKGGAGKATKKVDFIGRSKGPAAKSRSTPSGEKSGRVEAKGATAINFTNPAVASAFKRAIKKYSTALKRLTD